MKEKIKEEYQKGVTYYQQVEKKQKEKRRHSK